MNAKCLNELSCLERDSSIIVGKLDNGLTYYIKNNEQENDKIAYSLILKAGSLDEDESQRGLSHFNEHLSFDGTPTYNDGILDGRFLFENPPKGFFINALTTQSETVYWVTVPETRETLIDSTLFLLRDWLYADFNSEEAIAKQRGIIGKEWLEFQNLDERNRQQWFPVYYNNSKWATRQSIGLLDVINNAPKEEILRYRSDWYRPDLAAITVVGSINTDLVEQKIKQLFEINTTNKTSRPKEKVSIPDNKKRNIVITSDKEQQYSFLAIYHRRPAVNVASEEWITRAAQYSMMNYIMSDRLTEAQEANAEAVSYLGAMTFDMIKPDWIFSPNASINRGKVKEAIMVVAREQERIAQHGFLPRELEKAKAIALKQQEYKKDATSRSNQDWTKCLETEFLTNYPAMAPNIESELFIKAINSTTVQDMNKLHAELWNEFNSHVIVTVPEADLAITPSVEEINTLLEGVKKETLEAYKGVDISKPVYANNDYGKAGKIKQTKSLTTLPVNKYTLSNGAEVVCYHDSTKKGAILFEAISKGGKSLLQPKDALFADLACDLYNNGPVGAYSLSEFRRYLNGSQMSMNTSITDVHENIKGSVSTTNFELLLQRINLLFTDLSFTNDAYGSLLLQQKEKMKAQQANTTSLYGRFVKSTRSGLAQPMELSLADIDAMELSALEAILKDRFNNLSDFTFYFTGAVDEVDFEQLVTQYLGGGKTTKRENWKANKTNLLKGDHTFVLEAGSDPKAMVTYVIGAPFEMNMNNTTLLQAMSPEITKKLFQRIREELHLVYDIRMDLKFQAVPFARADYEITFQCEPKDADLICSEINKIFAGIITEGPAEEELEGIRAMMLNSKKMYGSDNAFRLGLIRSHDQYYKNDYAQQLSNIEFIEKMTEADLKIMLSQLFNNKDGVKAAFIMKSKQ
ncbi:MAG: M16 family metallopeptidase [Tannerellaceae bacterium]